MEVKPRETPDCAIEETLDPVDWDEFARLGHAMLDDMLTHMRTVRDRPVWRTVPEDILRRFVGPPPGEPKGLAGAYRDFAEMVLPYGQGNGHPRFWAWALGGGTPGGMLAEMLAAGLNSCTAFGDQAPVRVEAQVLDWLKELLGFPREASGVLLSGCSMAHVVALAVARNARVGVDVKRDGMTSVRRPLRVYGSSETHVSVVRALELLGLGARCLTRIPVDDEYRLSPDKLRRTIEVDRREGARPLCVVASAGAVNTGSFDDIEALADLCQEEDLWLHVDGAFGALTALAPTLRWLLAGIERADSVAFDLHKWLNVPYDAGAVLVRDANAHRETFQLDSGGYLPRASTGLERGPTRFYEYGPQMSRSFRALKVWMTIKEHGVEKLGRIIEQHVRQAGYLARRIEEEDELELLAPVPLNVVCFRFRPRTPGPGGREWTEQTLEYFNSELLIRLQAVADVVPSQATLGGRFALRVCIVGHRTRTADLDRLLDAVIAEGRLASDCIRSAGETD